MAPGRLQPDASTLSLFRSRWVERCTNERVRPSFHREGRPSSLGVAPKPESHTPSTLDHRQKETPAKGRGSKTARRSVSLFPPCGAFFLTHPRCQSDACAGIADGQPRSWHQRPVSKLNGVAPGWRGKALPALGLQGSPELFCLGLSQVSAFLQLGRAVRQAPASVDEDLRLMDPSLLIAMESPDPAVVAVNQPALSHDHAASTSVLAMVGLGRQVAFWLGSRPKKRSRPLSPPPS